MLNGSSPNAGEIRDELFKIIWAKGDDIVFKVDGYDIELKKNHLMFVTPLNNLEIQIENKNSITRLLFISHIHKLDLTCEISIIFCQIPEVTPPIFSVLFCGKWQLFKVKIISSSKFKIELKSGDGE